MYTLHRSTGVQVAGALLLSLFGASSSAEAFCSNRSQAVSNDLTVQCLVVPRTFRPGADPPLSMREQSMYRSLLSEMSVVMAVPVMEPADTTGFSGFHFSFDVQATSVSINNAYISGYRQADGSNAMAGVKNVSGQFLPVASLMLRKGVWFLPLPLFPSLEFGFGASNLLQSGIFGLNGYLKFALHEGYHDIPIPSIAVRASVSRLAGTEGVDLTIITAEGLISKAFGAKGTGTFEPFVGGGVLFSIARGQVIDLLPTADLYRGPATFDPMGSSATGLNTKIVFPTQDDIFRWRVFAGLNVHYSIVSVTGYFAYWGAGADNSFDINTPIDRPKDLAYSQFTVGGSIGLRF